MQDRIKELAVEAGFDADDGEITAPHATINGDPMDVTEQITKLIQAVARECLSEDESLIEAIAEHTYGHTRAEAIEWAKEDKFDSHCQQARELLGAMRPVIRARFGIEGE